MKKIRLLLTLFIVSLCSWQSAWARTAPTFPEAQTLESGNTYYLYNVGSGRFIYRDGSNERGSVSSRSSVYITDLGDGTYTIQYSSNNYYFYASAERMENNSNPSPSYRRFRFTETEGGYYIQRNNNYNENQYVVDDPDCYYIRTDHSSGNIVWQLLNVEKTDYYLAKKALYDALEAAAGYEFAIADYEAVYENEASTTAELSVAATELTNYISWSNAVAKHSLHDSPIFLVGDGWSIGASTTSNKNLISKNTGTGKTIEIKGVVDLATESTIYYKLYGYSNPNLQVFIDGNLIRSLNWEQIKNTYYYGYRDFVTAGKHEIVWKFTGTTSGDVQFQQVGAISTPQISVNLLEAGSLGTEVLYNVDHIKDVRNLKVTGNMNSDDWEKIKMMTNIFRIDLSEANVEAVPELLTAKYNIGGSYSRLSWVDNLYSFKLPNNLKSIGRYAFYQSLVEDIEIPSTVVSIGEYAFYQSRMKAANLSKVTDIANNCFNGCRLLKEIILSDNLNSVGSNAFSYCPNTKRQTITFPKTLTKIENYAFDGCSNLNFRFPEKHLTIERDAFRETGIDSLILHQSWSTVNSTWSPFLWLNKLVYAEIPIGVSSMNFYSMLYNCPNLKKIVLKSPTKVAVSEPELNLGNITLVVPSYLVNAYKLDNFWYNAKSIEGFSTADIKDWTINGSLTMNEHERFEGNPNIWLNSSWKLNGNDAQSIDNFTVSRGNGMILSNCDNVSVNDIFTINYSTRGKSWYFICLPFDISVNDITCTDEAQYVIRYYDGASRAANGTGGNWKNYAADAVILAGTGFIIQTNKTCTTSFRAIDNESKQNAVSNKAIVKTLEVHESAKSSNKGWNLVGNPWLTYYNIHTLNFTAPITVYNGTGYSAYSLTDDDYAIRPNEAFFVQCPNEEYNTIGFPIQGRQLTSVIESQNASRRMTPQLVNRQVVNLTIGNGEMEDMTRVVLNEQASTAYEVSCDASKFMSMDGSVPQIYTLDTDGTRYAINERPMGDGFVTLGFYAGAEGTYTITATRCDAKKVYVTDQLMGVTKEITDAPYSFSAEAGTDNTRFVLSFVSGETTGIQEIGKTAPAGQTEVFSIDGKFLGTDASHLGTGIYIVRQGKQVSKVVVR